MRFWLPLLLTACADSPPAAPPAAAPPTELVEAAALPAAPRSPGTQVPAGAVRVVITAEAAHIEGEVLPLADTMPALTERLTRRKAEEAPLAIRAPGNLPFERVARVLTAAALAGYRSWYVETGQGAMLLDGARACAQPATADRPCTTTWAQVTPDEMFFQNRGLAEVGCGEPFAAAPLPAPALESERGRCRRIGRQQGKLILGVVAPHIDRHIPGDRCDMASLSAWPEVPWAEVVAAADALRLARHGRVALGISRDRATCRTPLGTPSLEKAAAPGSVPPAAVDSTGAPSVEGKP